MSIQRLFTGKLATLRTVAFALVAVSVALFTATSMTRAQGQAQDDDGSQLPVKRIVMFNSGVAFFEHNGTITDDATVDLKFNVEDINDLLKSMVLQDTGGGRINTVNYASRDPITKTLKTFAIDLTENPTLADLLDQIRGERVEIQAPSSVTGSILGVEQRRQQVGENVIEVDVLNLLTDQGLRSVPLESIGSIKLLDEELNGELMQALSILAASHATDKKTVSLNFRGDGDRLVRVGYVQEAPIWKTSYRLVLGDDAPLVQGWAIVENTTEEDWDEVDLTLVSGRPISFLMDLYQPLYMPRPVVEPELFASLRPQNYDQNLARTEAEFGALADARRPLGGGVGGGGGGRGGRAGRGRAAPADESRRAGADRFREEMDADSLSLGSASGFAFNPASGVASIAQAGDVGELFEYHIGTPVTLPRQQSAMLPIVNDSVEATKVSIYNSNVQAKHPLNGLRLRNTSGVHLMQGPVTVFDGGVYAGDAQIPDMPPASERLMSYALDLDTEVAPESESTPARLTACVIKLGVMHISNKYQRSTKYTVKNSGGEEKTVLIEYPKDANWTLLEPEEPSEDTRDLYRFAVQASPGVPAETSVTEERVVSQQVAISNSNDDFISFYINAREVSQEVKDALAEVIRRKTAIAELATIIQQKQQEIQTIGQEQARIRENMAQLGRNTDLYNRYVQKFGEQEDRIEILRGEIRGQQQQMTDLQNNLNEYLLELNVE